MAAFCQTFLHGGCQDTIVLSKADLKFPYNGVAAIQTCLEQTVQHRVVNTPSLCFLPRSCSCCIKKDLNVSLRRCGPQLPWC